ncbi:MAG: DMT family transporter [Desulfobacterium sp.]
MQNILFYLLTILIWGSTWLGIKFQLGTVEPLVSVVYRFSLAAVILLAWCRITRLNMRFSLKNHGFMALQGALLFGFNYWLFYVAELHLTSGLAAVIFSTVLVMNMVNGFLFLRTPFDVKVIAGGALGLVGIVMVFRPEVAKFHLGDGGVTGVLLAFAATYMASLGNIISARNQKQGLPVIQTNAYGMTYGAVFMFLVVLFMGKSLTFVVSFAYIGSLIYLAVFGSIVAFGCYLSLIGRIGADRAAYATLIFPIVALVISTIWENYHWTLESVIGVLLILSGNLFMLKKKSVAVVKLAPTEQVN